MHSVVADVKMRSTLPRSDWRASLALRLYLNINLIQTHDSKILD